MPSATPAHRRRPRKAPEEEHENHERWLVTYADMVTLLMVLFIVMFAMSQVDQKKFMALKEGLAIGFGQSSEIQNGSVSILDQPGSAAVSAIAPAKLTLQDGPPNDAPPPRPAVDPAAAKAVADHDRLRAQQQYRDAQEEVDRLTELMRRLTAALRAHGLQDDVRTSIDDRGLVVSLVSRHVVFEPNLATLSARGRLVVDILAPVLKDLPDPLQIDGHTNQVKVQPKFYPTDWELSAARAVTVLRHLTETNGLPAKRLTATAFGHEKPLVDPRKPGSQRVNKRVDIVVLSTLPSETKEKIAAVLAARPRVGGNR